jgi:hypothetical protein
MKYKCKGRVLRAGCTPQPATSFDNRSCRERNPQCEGECISYVKCQWCGNEKRSLSYLEEVGTDNKFQICDDCERKIQDQIDYGR